MTITITVQPRSSGKTSSVRAAVGAAARLLRKAGYTWANGEWNAPARRVVTIWARNGGYDLVSFRDEWARAMAVDSRMPGLRLVDLAEVKAETVPNLTPSAIAAAVCQRVAELDDRSSPADWPEAMLVTQDELQTILFEELAAALPTPQAQPAVVQAEPVTLQMCSDLKPRTESEKAAYLAGVADGRMYAERDAAKVQAEPVMIYHGRCTIDCGEHGHHDVEMLKMIPAGAKLFTAPQAQPADALDAAFEAVRKRFCKLPRYSFLLDGKGNVRRVPSFTGNWVEFEAAHTLFAPQLVDDAMAAAQEGGAA